MTAPTRTTALALALAMILPVACSAQPSEPIAKPAAAAAPLVTGLPDFTRLVQQVSPARLVNIASARSQPVAGPQWGGRDAPEAPRAAPWRRRGLIAVACVTALALAATFWWMPGGEPKIRSRPLADAAAASRFDADTAIATHPDRVLLSMSEADAAVARDTAFYAWYQAERLGTSEYEPPPPTFEAPESSASSADTGGQGAP